MKTLAGLARSSTQSDLEDPMRQHGIPRVHVLYLALIAGTALATGAASAADSPRLGDNVFPTFQAIELELDADRPDYSGRVRIELTVSEPTRRFDFHSEGPELHGLVLAGPAGDVAVTHQPEGADRVSVRAAEPLAAGDYTLTIEFSNLFDTTAVSLYRAEVDGAGYAFTQFESDDAREAFPCWDQPEFKIPFQMTLTVPAGHLAISNTPVEKETLSGSRRTFVFAETKPLPTYLLAIATGPLETRPMPGLGVPGRVVTVKGQSHLAELAAADAPAHLQALEAYFGRPYPYEKLDFIAVPEFWPGGMENAGAITFADHILLIDPQAATASERQGMGRIIAHELAHMWFGDLVTMEWWDDLWLNESFADWMGDKINHQVHPEYGQDILTTQNAQWIMGLDARASTLPIRRPVETSGNLLEGLGLAYNKGKTVLGMFEQFLGPEIFRRGVVDYIATHAWGNAVAADLWQALDKASGQPVSAAMATFFEQPGLPRVDVEMLAGGRVKLSQERFRNHGTAAGDLRWQIPVALKYADGERLRTKTVLLRSASQVVDLQLDGRPQWIYPNAGAHGYYRWRLASDALRLIAARSATALTARERVELIGNVAALLDAGILRGDEYLAILGEIAADPEPMVVSSVIQALGRVQRAFVSAELSEPFARYVRRTLKPTLERFGSQKTVGEEETRSVVRPQLLFWLGATGRDADVLSYGRSLARSYLSDPSSIDPSLVGVALVLAAQDGDRALFDTYRERFESARIPEVRERFLAALGAFKDPRLQGAALRYSLEGPLRPNEILEIGESMVDPLSHDRLYRWFTENYDRIVERIPPLFVARLPRVAGGCSAQRLAAAKTFFSQPGHNVPGTARQLDIVAEQVTDCVHLRQREGAAVAKYLRQAGP